MTSEKENEAATSDDPQEEKKEIPLFREEVLQQRKGSHFGKNIIITPISFSIWTLGAFLVALTLGFFIYFGEYSKHQEVSGILIPNKGMAHVYAKTPGIVANRYVEQGDKIVQGQLLYLISTEQETLSGQGAVAQQVELLEKQLALQKNKVAMSGKNIERYKTLLDQKVISEAEYQRLYQEHLDVEFALHRTEQDLVNAKGAGDYAIRASADGMVSTLVARTGDRVVADKLLASIIPSGAELQAMLFVHTNAIGFVKVGQKVLLKYDAYPYQSFGLYDGSVDSIDKSILFPKDVDLLITSVDQKNPYASNDPFYRVIVNLKQQTVNVYGKPYPLTPGMTLKGDMLGDKRRIWQLILEPIYSLRGSLISQ
ncbi:MAG: HlyD family efflux transporter periplasmic adaptor subunit [Gammaproteobacteria bacterium]|nr:HlyD family efflux transporter periplasmic adaptor subunit [Gammaproteobacteria bacterium]